MTNEIAMKLSGILFLFILATGIASRALGYKLDDYDALYRFWFVQRRRTEGRSPLVGQRTLCCS